VASGHPTTPDGRYFVVKGQLWRCSNPALDEATRSVLVAQLMAARRAVRAANAAQDPAALRVARAAVQEAKVALGERGAPWWSDGSPDFNRKRIMNTPYALWWQALEA